MATLRDSLLKNARWYAACQRLVGADRAQRRMVADHLRPVAGSAVLDVGCGDAHVRPLLGAVDYVGVDLNDNYIDAAVDKIDDHTRLLHADVASLPGLGLGPFDLAMALGLQHHLPDDVVRKLIEDVAAVLRPGGRYVTMDPVFAPDGRTTARVLAALDRGRYVRDEPGYVRLFDDSPFELDVVRVRHDLLPIPYSHLVIEARRR